MFSQQENGCKSMLQQNQRTHQHTLCHGARHVLPVAAAHGQNRSGAEHVVLLTIRKIRGMFLRFNDGEKSCI